MVEGSGTGGSVGVARGGPNNGGEGAEGVAGEG
jgi:hypothetical protein